MSTAEAKPEEEAPKETPFTPSTLFPPITPPKIKIPYEFDSETIESLIMASMSVPLNECQGFHSLNKFPLAALMEKWEEILKEPPKDIHFEPRIENYVEKFTLEEDFAFITFIRLSPNGKIMDFMNKY